MSKPKQKPKKSNKLPLDSGIHQITLPPLNITPTHTERNVENTFSDSIVHASDRALLEQLKIMLENRHGRPYSTSEILRWSLWNCSWDI